MQILATLLLGATAVAAHGYVDTATIGGKSYQFYQPYTDPYTNPKVSPSEEREIERERDE